MHLGRMLTFQKSTALANAIENTIFSGVVHRSGQKSFYHVLETDLVGISPCIQHVILFLIDVYFVIVINGTF